MFSIHQKQLQVFIVILCTLVLGCWQIDKTEIYGIYEAKFDEGIERITLLQGDTYTQEIELKSGSTYFNKGSWTYSKIDKTITFNQVMSLDLTNWNKISFVADQLDQVVHVKTSSEITLNFNDDLGIYYRKIR
jgi:hypothetical protein